MSPKSKSQNTLLRLIYLGFITALVILTLAIFLLSQQTPPASASHLSDYETRKAQLLTLAGQPFVDDPMGNVETDLDGYNFTAINALDCPTSIDNSNGWSIEMRTGGRPFMNFDDIEINGTSWMLDHCTPGSSGISQTVINNHYNAGKTVNRMWFTHVFTEQVGNTLTTTYPTVLVMTPDGFFNVAGAQAPKRLGAATRIGFIGEPFDDLSDYIQHIDEVSIFVIDNDTLRIVYNIHSEAGEGVLELELKWDAVNEQPELYFRSAHAIRSSLPQPAYQLGFVGFDFMKGPTLSGLRAEYNTPEGGIQAFHDGRTVFLVHANGSIIRNLLISPIMTDTVVREDIATEVTPGSKMVLDQPQNVSYYFSKFPEPSYEQRTDLVLKLVSSTVPAIDLRRSQKSVDLDDPNPEANETVNVFYATEMSKTQVYEFSYILSVAAEDFEHLYSARRRGVVFISDRSESWSRLYFLALDAALTPLGVPTPLTDQMIADPHHPSASANGQSIIFDTDEYRLIAPTQRIYTLDLNSSAIRRLTIDPYGASNDNAPSFNSGGSLFSIITNRLGTPTRLVTASVVTGLGGGAGQPIAIAHDADWCHEINQITYADSGGLYVLDITTNNTTSIVTRTDILNPRFSPTCDQIAYAATSGLWIVETNGNNNHQVLSDASHPTWVDNDHLIFQGASNGNTDVYLLTISTGVTSTLTTDIASDSEPVYVKAVGPTIAIESLADGSQTCQMLEVSGFVASAGIPVVTVNGLPAIVEGDEWSITMSLILGATTLTAIVMDSDTALTSQDEINITIVEHCIYLPAILKDS